MRIDNFLSHFGQLIKPSGKLILARHQLSKVICYVDVMDYKKSIYSN